MISIDDIIKIDDKRKRIKKEIYTKIYEMFSAKIKRSLELGHKQLFMTIPVFLVGYPSFDRNAAARYITRQFSLGGFSVKLVSDFDEKYDVNLSNDLHFKLDEVSDMIEDNFVDSDVLED